MDNTTEAMSVDTGHAQVIARIGFAERWLHRAKAQCADGDVAGGLMTLSLADAEMRVALETGGWSRHRPSAPRPAMRRWVPWVTLAAATMASVWTLRPAAVPADAAVVDGPAVVRFSSNVGAVLSLMSVTPAPRAPVQVARPEVRPRTLRTAPQAPPRASAAPLRPAAAVAAPTVTPAITPAAHPLTITAPVPAPALSPAAPFVLSEVDLIDMVLAANQALRGTGP